MKNRELIVKMVQDKCQAAEICKAVSVGHTTLVAFLKHIGEPFDFSRSALSPTSNCSKHKEQLLRMCEEGASLTQMGKAIRSRPERVLEFLRANGVTRQFSVSGYTKEKSPHWRGGSHVDKDGYRLVYCPDHPYRRKHTPYMLEHRLVMEKMIGRYLLPEEVVHHRDKNKCNNSPENLQLFSCNSEHLAEELKGQCPKWGETGQDRIRKLIDQNAAKRRGQIRVPLAPDDPQSKQNRYRFVAPHETTLPAP